MAEKQDFKTKVKGAFGTKAFKSGGYSLLASVIVIVIVFALNMAVGALPANWTKFDMTDTGMFSLSDQSKELVKSIDEPVTIYVLQSGSNGETVYELALQYRALNSNITVEVRDPVANPGFVQQYTDEQLGYGVIVESARRSATVSSSSLYRTEMATDGSYQYYFDGESLITGALDKVTTDTLPKIYRLVGHGEAELSAALTASIETDNFELEDLSLLSMDSVPEDADCVLIHRPSSDLSEDDAAKLASYLEGGGAVMLFTEYPAGELTNLCALAAGYGLAPVDGLVVERNANYYISGYPLFLLPVLGEHEITSPLSNEQSYVLVPGAQGLTILDGARDTLNFTSLMQTSKDAISKLKGTELDTTEKEEGDIDGPFDLAYAVTEDNEDGQARFLWVAGVSITEDSAYIIVSGPNTGFLLNSLGWLTGKDSSVTIRSEAITNDYLTLTAGASTAWSIVFIAVLPLAVLAAGIVVYVIRRKRI